MEVEQLESTRGVCILDSSLTICVNIKYHTHHEMHDIKKCNSRSTSLDIWRIPQCWSFRVLQIYKGNKSTQPIINLFPSPLPFFPNLALKIGQEFCRWGYKLNVKL